MTNLVSTNPSRNFAVIGEVEVSTPAEVAEKIAAARAALDAWLGLGVAGRVDLMRRLASVLEEYKERFAALQAEEAGMPISEARGDFDGAMAYFRAYLDTAEEHLAPIVTYEDEYELHEVYREPYGVAACIVPWNFPFTNWVWQCGQVLVAGNTVVFKHSEETPLCGKLIEEAVCSVLPEGVFSEVYGAGDVGAALVNGDVDLICFTGSTDTGVRIRQSAASRLLPTSLELGGSAPGIVFEDADVDGVLQAIYIFRFTACGQLCDGLKRLLVHESRMDEVTGKLAALVGSRRIGDALDPETEVGPLVAERQVVLLEGQVGDALAKGARVLVGGKRPEGHQGAYYAPTLLCNVTREMRVWQEEVFGPVLSIVPFSTEAEAIALANDTKYGLGAYVFTQDNARYLRVAQRLQSGMVSQNTLSYARACNPFTGYKMSGGGRQHAQFGFDEVTQIKIIARQK